MSKYKVGDKFIIEIDDVMLGSDKECNNSTMYRIKGFNTLVFDRYGLDKLQQINPKLKIEDIDDMLAEHDLKKEAYEKGLADAWELARKVNSMSEDEFDKCFNFDWQCTTDFTYQEILAMVEACEKSKQIQVGDVVYANGVQGVVIDIISDDDCYIYDENGCIEVVKFEKINKTGRKVDIEHLLEQIRGNE